MTGFSSEVKDNQVQEALRRLVSRASNMQPLMQGLAVGITERTQHRFEISTAPDGTPWARNRDATIAMLANRLAGSKSNRKKDGSLNAKGARALANKKPLIDSGFLSQQIIPTSTPDSLSVTATAAYAAIQNWGGITGAKSWIPGKKIPARTFFPIHPDGSLYPRERDSILADINDYLMDGLQ